MLDYSAVSSPWRIPPGRTASPTCAKHLVGHMPAFRQATPRRLELAVRRRPARPSFGLRHRRCGSPRHDSRSEPRSARYRSRGRGACRGLRALRRDSTPRLSGCCRGHRPPKRSGPDHPGTRYATGPTTAPHRWSCRNELSRSLVLTAGHQESSRPADATAGQVTVVGVSVIRHGAYCKPWVASAPRNLLANGSPGCRRQHPSSVRAAHL